MAIGTVIRRGLRVFRARGLLRELQGIRVALERANELKEIELRAALPEAFAPAPPMEDPSTVVTFSDAEFAAETAVIEEQLTRALGQPPTEEEILAEYERLHSDPDDPRRLETIEAPWGRGGDHG